MVVRHLMLFRYKKIILILITVFAFLIRFVGFNQAPPGFTWDEAALGYNAYSILKTGKDEYGQPFPMIFKSFGDYKPGLYVYLDIPFVAIMGLNELSTRMPSIILGSLLPLLMYFLIKEIFGQENTTLGLIGAGLIALSPWAIHFSRGAWEANIALFETILALILFLKSRSGNRTLLFFSVLLFGATIYTYQSAKLFSTLLVICLIFIYRKTFVKKNFLAFTIALIAAFVLTLSLSFIDPKVRSRLAVLNQHSYKRSDQEMSKIRQEESKGDKLSFNLFHFEDLEYFRTISTRYLGYFSPKFLFSKGALTGRDGLIDYGAMQLFELPFFLAGIYYFLRIKSANKKVVFLILAIAPLSGALSRDILSTVRTLPLLIPLELISALGIYKVFSNLYAKKNLFFPILVLSTIFSLYWFGFYLDRYFIHFKYSSSQYWLYGYKEAINYVIKNQNKYDKVVFTTKLNEPYIFYLFYTQYDPLKYQKQSRLIANGQDVGEVPAIDKIEFRPIYWSQERSTKNTLFIGGWLEIPDQDIDPKQSEMLKVIKYYDGAIAFKIAATKK